MKDITPQDLIAHIDSYILVDVREADEFTGPLGHIEGAVLIPLGQELQVFFERADPSKSYVFICRSGHRSALACELAPLYGFSKAFNLKGGMIEWGRLLKGHNAP